MARTIVFVPSPLTGPATWSALAPLFAARGWRPLITDLRAAMNGPSPLYPALVQAIVADTRAQARNGDLVLVAHSGAGALLPAAARELGAVRAAVFVDALLPHPGRSWVETAPAGLKDRLRASVNKGRLPPWHKWWPEGAIAAMIGAPELSAKFIGELSGVPLGYLEERAPPDAMPVSVSCAYLRLSEGYRDEADQAEAMGWPVKRLALNHLAMLSEPEIVFAGIEELLLRC